MANVILSVTAFFHFTILNVHSVCHHSNGGRIKVKLNPPEKAWFIVRLPKLRYII